MNSRTIIRQGASVCPVCKKRIPAHEEEDRSSGKVWQVKVCPTCGEVRTIIWNGYMPIESWRGDYPEMLSGDAEGCPDNCGLCSNHLRDTCCILYEVTNRCNFNCRFCFARGGESPAPDKSLERIRKDIEDMVIPGKSLVQLSGGEPTVRDDLPEIVRYAKSCGAKYVQLNTNGRRLAADQDYLRRLKEAGLSFVFLQFDGTDDKIYDALRGESLFAEKCRIIEACAGEQLGVTLVMTVVPGVNDDNIGDTLRFAVSNSPKVRGLHLQPVSYFGRVPHEPAEADRYTLDMLIRDVVGQSEGLISVDNLKPSACDHPLCGFHGDFVVMPGDRLLALSKGASANKGFNKDQAAADKNREFVGRRWQREPDPEPNSCEISMPSSGAMDMMSFLKRIKSHGFTVTSMAFQDAWNLSLERLRSCSLHVYDDGKIVPFCSYYL